MPLSRRAGTAAERSGIAPDVGSLSWRSVSGTSISSTTLLASGIIGRALSWPVNFAVSKPPKIMEPVDDSVLLLLLSYL